MLCAVKLISFGCDLGWNTSSCLGVPPKKITFSCALLGRVLAKIALLVIGSAMELGYQYGDAEDFAAFSVLIDKTCWEINMTRTTYLIDSCVYWCKTDPNRLIHQSCCRVTEWRESS